MLYIFSTYFRNMYLEVKQRSLVDIVVVEYIFKINGSSLRTDTVRILISLFSPFINYVK